MQKIWQIILLALIGFSVGCTPSQTNQIHKQSNTSIKASAWESIEQYTLENGLEVLLWPNSNEHSHNVASVNLVIHAGSLDESDDQLGYAHFVEHMLFNQPQNDIKDKLQKLGLDIGWHANAYTHFDHTRYHLKILDASPVRLKRSVDLLAQFAVHSVFDPGEVAAEKGVVREEWRLRVPPKGSYAARSEQAALAGSHYAKRLPIGNLDSIQQSSAEGLQTFFEQHYYPANASIIVTGDFDTTIVKRYIQEAFSSWQTKEKPVKPVHALPEKRVGEVLMVKDEDRSNYWVLMGFDNRARLTGKSDDDAEYLRFKLINRVLEQRLHKWSMEQGKGLRDISIFDSTLAHGIGQFGIYWQTNDEHLRFSIEEINKQLVELKVHGISEQELNNWRKVLWRKERGEKDGARHLANVATGHLVHGGWLRNQDDFLELISEQVMNWSVAEVNESIARLLDGDMNVELVYGTNLNVPSVQQVSTWMQQSTAQLLADQVDSATNAQASDPLLWHVSAAPGKVLEQSKTDNGVNLYTLSNGMQVMHIESDYQPNKVIMQLFALGGWNGMPQDEVIAARFALPVLSSSGLRNFDGPALKRWLEDESMLFEGKFNFQYRGLDLQASTDQLDSLFALLHIGVTEMKADEGVLDYIKQQFKDEVETTQNLPYWPLIKANQKHLLSTETGMHAMSLIQINDISVEAVDQVYEKVFMGTQNYQLSVVGDISSAQLVPLLERYVANIPVRESGMGSLRPYPKLPKTYINHANDRPEQEANFDIYFYVDKENLPGLTFAKATLFGSWLRQQLTDELREKHGLTYDLRIYINHLSSSDQSVSLNVDFDGDPQKVDKIVRQLHVSLTDLVARPVEQADVDRVADLRRQDYQYRDDQIEFLLHELAHAEFHGWTPEQVGLAYERYPTPRAEEFSAWLQAFIDPQLHTYGEIVFMP